MTDAKVKSEVVHEFPGYYEREDLVQVVRKEVRVSNAIYLMKRCTDTRAITAQHTSYTNDEGEKVEGIWFSRRFRSHAKAVEFAKAIKPEIITES